jgi:hypothetical protein
MKIEESYVGEVAERGAEEVLHDIAKALGVPRGGELQLVADLSSEMTTLYARRMEQMLADFAELEAAGEA